MAHRAGGRGDAAGQGGGPRQYFRGGDPAAGPSNFQQGGYQDPRNGGGRGFQGNFNNQNFNNQGNFNNQANYNNQGNFNEFQGGGPPGDYGDFHPGAGGNDFFGRGNGNNGYRNRRRYEFRGTRPSGGAIGGRGFDRNRSYNQEAETAVVQHKAGTGANLQQNQPPTVVQRNNTNVTFQPKKNTVKPTTVQQPPAKATTVQQKTSIQHTSDVDPGTSIGAGTVANQTKKKDKDPEKVKCFRCDIVGHFSIDCTAVICDVCESPDHANKDCPLHSAPKPSLSIYGYGQEELVFLEVQPTPSYRPKSDNGRMGRITVTGGELTMEKIVERLRWFVDDTFQWDVQPHGKNVYKTQFPNKLELARATRIGLFQVKGTTCSMEITEWKSATKPIKKLEEAWVLISGVPDDLLRNYLSLWGLGGLIGKTKEVDMTYTRRHGVVRSLVKVVDIAHIPYQKEFWHEDECYLLTIELEEYDMAIDGEETNLSPKEDDGNDDTGNNDKNTQSGSTKDKPNSDKQTEKHNDGSKNNKSGGVIINAPGAHTVNLDTAISFGSFCNTKVHDKETPKDGDVPTSCRRLFRTPPASPARSVLLPVHAGTRSEPSERATDASNMYAIA
ncbi:hypothetical protein QYE76_015759 [Lolium multiflorum]|uniref:CCHC-type domain-containing protein n=1 Tax=Lolium multiflorum TaxID=4521 RepID=A0AAD8X9H0_LOLMU|nr:hypothetical protein QYE76_015759 [Lolium multiflorum]